MSPMTSEVVAISGSPIQFVKGLSDPLQPNRLAAMKSLNSWFDQFGRSYAFSSIEIDQLWRGLQLTLWMADKRPVQQQVAAESVLLGRKIDSQYLIEWNRGFWFNVEKIYENVDKYRVPKVLLLIRIFESEMLHQVKERSFDADFVSSIVEGVTQNLRKATGAYIQVVSILVDELLVVLGGVSVNDNGLAAHIQSEEGFLALLKLGTHVIDNAHALPLTLVKKCCESLLAHPLVAGYSVGVKSALKSLVQTKAQQKQLEQDVREVLYACADSIDQVEVKETAVSKKKKKAATKE